MPKTQPSQEPVSEIALLEGAVEVAVPYAGAEYICPNCEAPIPIRRQINLSKPPKYAHVLNDVVKCPFCMFAFSYRSRAFVLRQ